MLVNDWELTEEEERRKVLRSCAVKQGRADTIRRLVAELEDVKAELAWVKFGSNLISKLI